MTKKNLFKKASFNTYAEYDKIKNQILFITKDIPYVTEEDSNSLIQLLKDLNGNIIGFKIKNPDSWMKYCKD